MRIIFLKSEMQDVAILGRSVKEHMLLELGVREEDAIVLGENEEVPNDEAVILSLNMPLISRDEIFKIVERMRAKDIAELRLGGADSPSRITLKSGGRGYFSNDECFLKIVDAKSYSMVYNHLRRRVVNDLLARGVHIPFADSVIIDASAKVEAGAKILPFSRIEGKSKIAAGAEISASYIADSEVGEGASVNMSHVVNSVVAKGASVGPFARLRSANVAAGCRIGDFVEVKAANIGEGAKAAHLAYIGDADVGERANIGCGAVFCNFDGKQKHRTSVGADSFIGANCNLVAPVSVGEGAFVAAGTTITDDVPQKGFCIGRARQTTKTV